MKLAQVEKANDDSSMLQEGDEIEISPLALSVCEELAMRIKAVRGAALLIDYGVNFTQGDSIRAFYKHSQVSIFSQPGLADMVSEG